MANMLEIVLKIKDFLIIIAACLVGAIRFLLRHLWRFISLLRTLGSGFKPSVDLGDIKSGNKFKLNASPQISEDNSEASEFEEDIDVVDKIKMQRSKSKSYQSQPKKILEGEPLLKKSFLNEVSTASSSAGETTIRRRNVDGSNNSKYDHCQVCGSNPPTMYCEGPRCYTFFCSECEVLYHKHARRKNHVRKDISTYNPNAKPAVTPNVPFDLGVPSTSKAFQTSTPPPSTKPDLIAEAAALQPTATNVANIPPPPTMEDLTAAAANFAADDDILMLGEAEALEPNTWQCKFCTIVNPIDTRICQMCCKTNTPLNQSSDMAQAVIEEDVPAEIPPKPPTKLTKKIKKLEGDNLNENNKLYDRFWQQNNQPESDSPTPTKDELPQTSAKREQNRSAGGRGNTGQPKNISVIKPEDSESLQKFDEELTGSDNAMAYEQLGESTENTAATWECSFCTLVNSATTYICVVCGKSNPKTLLKKNRNAETEEHDSNASAEARSDVAAQQPANFDNNKNPDTDLLALNFMEENHIENYEVAQLASVLVRKNFRLQDAIEAAKNCSSLDDALAYLQQQCPLCDHAFVTRDMIQMLHCTHRCCERCTRRYFTTQIRTYDITSFVCPICETPSRQSIEYFNNEISDYFSYLSNLLKPILAAVDHEMYQKKLTDWFLQRQPNFKKCPNCPYGGILENSFIRMECPQCNVTTCLQCKKTWHSDHEGKTCDEFTTSQEKSKNKGSKNNKKNDQSKSSNQQPQKKNFMKGIKEGFKGLVSYSNSASDINPAAQTTAVIRNKQTEAPQRTNDSYAGATNSQSSSSYTQQQIRDSQYPPLENRNNTISTYSHNFQNPSQQSYGANNPGAISKRPQNFGNNASDRNINNNTGGVGTARSAYGTIDASQNYASRVSNNAPTRTEQLYSNPANNSNNNSSISLHETEIPLVEWNCSECKTFNNARVTACKGCRKSYDKYLDEPIQKSKSVISDAFHVPISNRPAAGNIEVATDALKVPFEGVGSGETETQWNNYGGGQVAGMVRTFENTSISSHNVPNSNSETLMDWTDAPFRNDINSPNIGSHYISNQEQLNVGSINQVDTYNTNVASTNSNTDYAASNHYYLKEKESEKMWQYSKEAIMRQVPLEELQVAMLHCGEEDPFVWLNNHWQTNIAYVKLTASHELSKFGDVSATNIPPVTDVEARNALIKHQGNCQMAINECLEESQIKLLERQSVGEPSSEVQRVLAESTRKNVGVETFPQERIISHQEMQSDSLANRTQAILEKYSKRRNDLPATHVFGSGNLTTRTGLSSNSGVDAYVQSQFSRINSAANTLTQVGVTSSTMQNQMSSSNVGTSRSNDGVHEAKPAFADFK